MKDYFQKSMDALRLAGLGERTQESYTRAVRQIVEFFDQTPDQLTEEQLQEYFLHRSMVDEWKPATLRVAQTGIKFFFINVLKREWHLFSYLVSVRKLLVFMWPGARGSYIVANKRKGETVAMDGDSLLTQVVRIKLVLGATIP